MKFIIEKEAAQKLLDYLQQQPYVDVFDKIPLLMARGPRNPMGLEEVKEPEAEPDEST